LRVTGAGKSSVLVADMEAGAWTLERNGKAGGTLAVTPEEGVGWFAAQREIGRWCDCR
jgi:hypothetical protein